MWTTPTRRVPGLLVALAAAWSPSRTTRDANLKRLARRIKTEKNVSFHVSRHSYADFARRAGVDLYTISKTLGHSSLKTTERYMDDFDANAVHDAMQIVWETK